MAQYSLLSPENPMLAMQSLKLAGSPKCPTAVFRSTRRLFFVSLLCTGMLVAGTGSSPAVARQGSEVSPSIMEIPVQMPLDPLFRATEQAVPTQAGNWQDWKSSHGVQTKYRAWRGPLAFRMTGDELLVQAHIRYWIKARAKLLHKLGLKSDCGVKEPPRQAVVGVLVRFEWMPDWSLRPRFRVLPTRFLDRCEMTVANIDVTRILDKVFRQNLQDSLRAALRSLAPRLSGIRLQAQRAWSRLQDPVELGDDTWLSLRPSGVALSPLLGRDETANTHIALVLYPELTIGPKPLVEQRPLPRLWLYYPRSAGLSFQVALDLDFSELGYRIAASLKERPIDLRGRQVGIEAIRLNAREQEIKASIQLSGDAAGTVEIRADLSFSPQTQQLRLIGIEYLYQPEDPAIALLSDLFYERIRQQLEHAANRLLASRLEQWKGRLLSGLSKTLPEDVQLDLSSLRLDSVKIRILENTLRLEGLAAWGEQKPFVR
jgi:hypothetical protein